MTCLTFYILAIVLVVFRLLTGLPLTAYRVASRYRVVAFLFSLSCGDVISYVGLPVAVFGPSVLILPTFEESSAPKFAVDVSKVEVRAVKFGELKNGLQCLLPDYRRGN